MAKSKTACSTFNRLSKSTFLTLLGPPPASMSDEEKAILAYHNEGQTASEIAETTGLTNKEVRELIKEVTTPKNSSNPSRAFFESLDSSTWSIVSFDPMTRVVCVRIDVNQDTRTVSVILPAP